MTSNRPAYYKAELRSRTDIVRFLTEHDAYYRFAPSTNSPLAWNVRDYRSDLSPDHLIEVYRKSYEDEPWLDFPEWREPAMEQYEEIKDRLWDWAIDEARDLVNDCDCYKTLWNGRSLDVEYGFVGRSGGWLIMTRFDGRDLARMERDDFREWLEEMPYQDLRDLYQLVVQNDHDFRREAVSAEIETRAAWIWIENVCADIPQPEMTQSTLAFS